MRCISFRSLAVWVCPVVFVLGALAAEAAADVAQARLITNTVGRISSQISGERAVAVREVLVREGDRVKKGDVLARLNTETLLSSLAVAQRALEQAEARREVAQAELAGVKLQHDRQVKLEASAAFRRATLEDVQIALRSAESQLKRVESDVALQRAEIDRIQLEVRQAEVVAPYDGVVLAVAATPGASVTNANPDIMTILDLSRVEIELTVAAAAANRFEPGRKVTYAFADGKRRQGEVRVLMPAASGSSDVLVRVRIASGDLPALITDKTRVVIHLDS